MVSGNKMSEEQALQTRNKDSSSVSGKSLRFSFLLKF